jgi:hypothetical protein
VQRASVTQIFGALEDANRESLKHLLGIVSADPACQESDDDTATLNQAPPYRGVVRLHGLVVALCLTRFPSCQTWSATHATPFRTCQQARPSDFSNTEPPYGRGSRPTLIQIKEPLTVL